MSAANVAEETKADVEAVKSVEKSVEDASYPTLVRGRRLRAAGRRRRYFDGWIHCDDYLSLKHRLVPDRRGHRDETGRGVRALRVYTAVLLPAVFDYHCVRPVLRRRDIPWAARFRGRRKRELKTPWALGRTTPSLPPTPRHSRKMMRDGLVYDFTRGAFVRLLLVGVADDRLLQQV